VGGGGLGCWGGVVGGLCWFFGGGGVVGVLSCGVVWCEWVGGGGFVGFWEVVCLAVGCVGRVSCLLSRGFLVWGGLWWVGVEWR